ncbi:amidase [uncultured Sulfitobacter sp.]|uniref:amidase n=1 Tax=uncultured Sulfitobacter sp. TaxID=191468 RepID=UPI00259162B8|nr:amidase [uncultured Sulfitobacter sp.]
MKIGALDTLRRHARAFRLELDGDAATAIEATAENLIRLADLTDYVGAPPRPRLYDHYSNVNTKRRPIQLGPNNGNLSSDRLTDYQSRYGCFLSVIEPRGNAAIGTFPVALKDVFAFDDHQPTAGLATPPAGINLKPSTVVKRVQEAGGYITATTKLSQWCYLPIEWNEFVAPPVNPLGADRLVGGSSSGAAVSVASGAVPVALGTDTGGSVRIPAALCGVYGFKPSATRVPMDGIIPLGPTQDTVGILARDLDVLRQMFQVIADEVRDFDGHSGNINVGIPDGLLANCDFETIAALKVASAAIAGQGGVVHTRPPLPLERLNAVAGILTGSEAARYHGPRMAQFPNEYASSVADRLCLGMAFSTAIYDAAMSCRYDLAQSVASDIFGNCEFLMLPVVEKHRYPLANPNNTTRGQLSKLSLNVLSLNRWVNLLGLPALSIPITLGPDTMAAVQLVGRFGEDESLFKVAERITAQ